jgi:hypothetical protein
MKRGRASVESVLSQRAEPLLCFPGRGKLLFRIETVIRKVLKMKNVCWKRGLLRKLVWEFAGSGS